jgi:hypothetical protein
MENLEQYITRLESRVKNYKDLITTTKGDYKKTLFSQLTIYIKILSELKELVK